MRHDHHRCREVGDGPLEPLHGLEVEVVGGLVEQQHLWATGDGPGQGCAGEFAARQAGQRAVELIVRQAEAAGAALHPRAPVIPAGGLKIGMRALVLGHGVGAVVATGHARLDGRQALLGITRVSEPLLHVLAHRPGGRRVGPLVMQRHPLAPRNGHRPAIGLFEAGENSEEGRLAHAVAPDDRKTVTGTDPERHSGEQRARAERLGEPGCLHDP